MKTISLAEAKADRELKEASERLKDEIRKLIDQINETYSRNCVTSVLVSFNAFVILSKYGAQKTITIEGLPVYIDHSFDMAIVDYHVTLDFQAMLVIYNEHFE